MAANRADRLPSLTQAGSYHVGNCQEEKLSRPGDVRFKNNLLINECHSGHISTWPAFGTEQTILQKRKPCTTPDLKYYSAVRQKANVVSKPRYLEQLESYLRKELHFLDLTKENAQELKLQTYREVFDYFIEHFKTYKPLLSAIKNEYEVTLVHQRQQICSLEALKTLLMSVSEHCDQKIQAMREEERLEIKTLTMEKHRLMEIIDKMKEENHSLQVQVSKMHEELAKGYILYRNERDARKLLISDMNELKYEQDTQITNVHKEHGEDPATLAVALRVARKDLTQIQVELNTMKADYGDVVSRRDFENQEKQLAEFIRKVELLQKDLWQLQTEHKSLLEINHQVVQQRDNFHMKIEDMQRCSTPRPNWKKCADVFPGGIENWLALSLEKSSDQLVDIMLTEICTQMLNDKDFFTGKGKGENIPVHLRHEGLVKNLKLTIQDVSNLLQNVWKEKTASDEQKGKRSSMPEFFLNYLQKMFGDSAIEWSYTVHESCRVHMTDEQMHLFYKILIGEVEEDIYHEVIHNKTYMKKELMDADNGL
ncbi:translin-associated factor X-interacting protein 1 isoform X2 [Spea bombifrons]|uniref:translin-associated factor X-interacting protein 1 isoform X2 n=1 Tax=Spea bombifrons TaxID=233779 RepID=UPI002348FA3F|nr:translin-associated factor X-interacting protein 1 isoform X2 [Spea bombifrons]